MLFKLTCCLTSMDIYLKCDRTCVVGFSGSIEHLTLFVPNSLWSWASLSRYSKERKQKQERQYMEANSLTSASPAHFFIVSIETGAGA